MSIDGGLLPELQGDFLKIVESIEKTSWDRDKQS